MVDARRARVGDTGDADETVTEPRLIGALAPDGDWLFMRT